VEVGGLKRLGRGSNVLPCGAYVVDDGVHVLLRKEKTDGKSWAAIGFATHHFGVECVACAALVLYSNSNAGAGSDDDLPRRGLLLQQIGTAHRDILKVAVDADSSFDTQLRLGLRLKADVAAKFTDSHSPIHRLPRPRL